jgi:hypothetical protein
MSLLVLLAIIYVKDPPEFSGFPTILLTLTLFRLALNISSTRQILVAGYAGHDHRFFRAHRHPGQLHRRRGGVHHPGGDQLRRHHQGRGPHRRGVRPLHPRRHAGQADGDRRRAERRNHRRGTATKRRLKIQKEATSTARWTAPPSSCAATRRGHPHHPGQRRRRLRIIGVFQMDLSLAESLQKFTLLLDRRRPGLADPALIISIGAGLLVTRASGNMNLGTQIAGPAFPLSARPGHRRRHAGRLRADAGHAGRTVLRDPGRPGRVFHGPDPQGADSGRRRGRRPPPGRRGPRAESRRGQGRGRGSGAAGPRRRRRRAQADRGRRLRDRDRARAARPRRRQDRRRPARAGYRRAQEPGAGARHHRAADLRARQSRARRPTTTGS